ncbi:hypothetical protein LZ654_20690 [Lelliottia amnigena]|uniref:hypothetical protein n=1 Tax=Lelliottia amnigena TaxID=61646 RepID=UPI001F325650|nr:hypothetical protein [Lelliottia amnigena]MCE9967227.1 hypothetical protein [Lelliottia amnigena]
MHKDLNSKIRKLKENLEEVGNTTQLTFPELFNSNFLRECSSFTSIEELFEKSGFKVESPEDFKAIPDDEWERFIVQNTTYDSWLEMQNDAVTKLLNERMMQGL